MTIKFIKLIVAMTFVVALGITAFAGEINLTSEYCAAGDSRCDHVENSLTKKVHDKFAEECGKRVANGEEQPKLCMAFETYQKIFIVLKQLAGGDGRFLPGDRTLLLDTPQIGALRLGMGRSFVSFTPLLKDSATIKVQKKAGKGGAFVRICAVDDNGGITHLGSIKFDEDGKPETKELTVNGTSGKVLSVRVESFSGSFDYTMTTKAN